MIFIKECTSITYLCFAHTDGSPSSPCSSFSKLSMSAKNSSSQLVHHMRIINWFGLVAISDALHVQFCSKLHQHKPQRYSLVIYFFVRQWQLGVYLTHRAPDLTGRSCCHGQYYFIVSYKYQSAMLNAVHVISVSGMSWSKINVLQMTWNLKASQGNIDYFKLNLVHSDVRLLRPCLGVSCLETFYWSRQFETGRQLPSRTIQGILAEW